MTHPDGTPGSGPGSTFQQSYIQTVAAAEVAAAGRVVMGLGEALGLGHAAGKQGPAHCSHCHWSPGLTCSRVTDYDVGLH